MKSIILYTILVITASQAKASTNLEMRLSYQIAASSRMDSANAVRLAKMFSKSCKRYGVPCSLLVAIAAQESMFNATAYNAKSQDYGMMQINIKTAKAMNLDLKKMLRDEQYSIDAGAAVLAYMQKRFAGHEQLWYCRYNVGTGNLTARRKKACMAYARKVSGHGLVVAMED